MTSRYKSSTAAKETAALFGATVSTYATPELPRRAHFGSGAFGDI
jgi:hypothetical protein